MTGVRRGRGFAHLHFWNPAAAPAGARTMLVSFKVDR